MHLTDVADNRDIADAGIVTITDGDNTQEPHWRAANVLSFDTDYPCQVGPNLNNCWFCIDFKERRVGIDCYSLRSYIDGFMVSWRIEVSLT